MKPGPRTAALILHPHLLRRKALRHLLLRLGFARVHEAEDAVSAAALRFMWTRHEDAGTYRLEIYDRGLEPVFESSPLVAEKYDLPADALVSFKKGEVYFWKVVAALKDNQTIESEFTKFILQK